MICIRDTRNFHKILTPYQPAPHIAEGVDRFLARTELGHGHRLWTGKGYREHRRPHLVVCGATHTIHDFAYQAFVGEIWPHLKAVGTCVQPLCVEPQHLRLTRLGQKPEPLEEADWDCLAELLYLRADRAPHRHLRDEWDVAAIYGVPDELARYELLRRNATKAALASSITFDATRSAVG